MVNPQDVPEGDDLVTDDLTGSGVGDPASAEAADAGVPGTEEVPDAQEMTEFDLDTVVAERDEYRDALLRVKAEFDNFRKRTERERQAMAAQVSARLVGELLAVLDSCDAAIAQGADDVEPVRKALVDLLGKEGLEVLPESGVAFDPHLHEAVLHEDGEGTPEGGPEVVETLRTGYLWQGTVLRPAMVRVRG